MTDDDITAAIAETGLPFEYFPSAGWMVNGENLPVLKTLPAKCLDAIVSDPPWMSVPSYPAMEGKSFKRSWGEQMTMKYAIGRVMDEFPRLMKAHGSVSLGCGTISAEVFLQLLYEQFPNVRELIWEKGGSRNVPPWTTNFEKILVGYHPAFRTINNNAARGEMCIFKCKRVNGRNEKIHPAEKPIGLIRWLLSFVAPDGGNCS